MPHYKHSKAGRLSRQSSRASSTAGSTKGPNCQASALDRVLTKKNRSYKWPTYHYLETKYPILHKKTEGYPQVCEVQG